MSTVALIFPHQLFADHPVLARAPVRVVLVEDTLFFGDADYPARFHVQKLAYHRATMAAYAARLEATGHTVELHRYTGPASALGTLAARLADEGHERLVVADVHDFMLQRRLKAAAASAGLALASVQTPAFLNDPLDNADFRAGRMRWHMADFYRWQRTRLGVLVDAAGEPAGGRWSFDEDNRRKLPKKEKAGLPSLPEVPIDAIVNEAVASVKRDFADHPGSLDGWYYPIDHAGAARWLERFVDERLARFGPYEDAIASGESWLYHGVLTPMLNTGLLTPRQVLDAVLAAGERDGTGDRVGGGIPINSLEGFVRQIIGWREFMRATYDDLGVAMRTTNHWGHVRPMPQAFYDGTTGIEPVDDAIRRTLATGYCHHIERLMVLGGFMFLCEIDPDDIYRWFMEMYIDAYDWVMVPNVYAMSQHADGGSITTKPYFSGSNYVRRMSDHARGDWCDTWDALFWRWVIRQSDALAGNPRWSMMVANARRMPEAKRAAHLQEAERFLAVLDGG